MVESTPKRRIAAQYRLAESAVRRHAAAHIPVTLALAAEAADVVRAGDLLAEARRLQAETWRVLEAAKAEGNLGAVLAAVDRAQRGLALLGTMLAEAGTESEITFRWESD